MLYCTFQWIKETKDVEAIEIETLETPQPIPKLRIICLLIKLKKITHDYYYYFIDDIFVFPKFCMNKKIWVGPASLTMLLAVDMYGTHHGRSLEESWWGTSLFK